MQDELTRYLDTLARDDCYRVDAVLKESPHEITERVFFIGANGEEQGPYVRKRFGPDSKMGLSYERIFETQSAGKRFLHIPRVLKCEHDADGLLVLMEWVTGESLEDVVAESESSLQVTQSVFPLLCDAVIELHEGFDPPIIHRDLTPSNVIISRDSLTLIDFGIARTYDEKAMRDTTYFGTRGFAPPEQFGYGQTSVRSDVYALGMLLLYCLEEDDPSSLPPETPLDIEGISPQMREVLAKATAFDPKERYASVRELKGAFLNALRCDAGTSDAGQATREYPPPVSPPVRLPAPVARQGEKKATAGGVLQRVPAWLGITWNVLVVALWVICLAGAVNATFFPTEQIVDYPLGARVFLYIGIFAIALAFIAYLLLDKRRLRTRIKPISGLSWRKELPYCLAIAFVVILLSALIGAIITIIA